MNRWFRSLRNKLYFFKGLKEVRDSENLIFYECLKCNSEIIGYKRTGRCKLVCSWGKTVKVYTGRNTHFVSGGTKYTKTIADEKTEKERKEKVRREEEAEKERFRRKENFNNFLHSDLNFLCNFVSYKRDLIKQVNFNQCTTLLDGVSYKEGYKRVLEYLKYFLWVEFCSNKFSLGTRKSSTKTYKRWKWSSHNRNNILFTITFNYTLYSLFKSKICWI